MRSASKPPVHRVRWLPLAVLALLVGLGLGLGHRRGSGPDEGATEACRRHCHPLPSKLVEERRVPNATEGWRNYPTSERCTCGSG